MTESTARPWKCKPQFYGEEFCYMNITQDDGAAFSVTAATVWANVFLDGKVKRERGVAEANAALIVKAVNNHDALVRILEKSEIFFKTVLDALDVDIEDTKLNFSVAKADGTKEPINSVSADDVLTEMRSILLRVEGEQHDPS